MKTPKYSPLAPSLGGWWPLSFREGMQPLNPPIIPDAFQVPLRSRLSVYVVVLESKPSSRGKRRLRRGNKQVRERMLRLFRMRVAERRPLSTKSKSLPMFPFKRFLSYRICCMRVPEYAISASARLATCWLSNIIRNVVLTSSLKGSIRRLVGHYGRLKSSIARIELKDDLVGAHNDCSSPAHRAGLKGFFRINLYFPQFLCRH